MTTKYLHNIYFHNHWPTITLGMQHTATAQYTSYIIQVSIILAYNNTRHAAHSHNTVHQLHNTSFHNYWLTATLGMQHTVTTQYYTVLASIAQTMSNNLLSDGR